MNQILRLLLTSGRKAVFVFAVVIVSACSDFLAVEAPRTQLVGDSVFATDATAVSAVSGIYSAMMTSGSIASGGVGSMSLQAGFSADEFVDLGSSPINREFYRNSLDAGNSTVGNMWANLYQYVFYANSILEGLESSEGLSVVVRRQVEGEARFVRAFSYFYLVNLFGDVPLVTTTDFRVSSLLPRAPVADVYALVVDELVRAQELMAGDYSHAGSQRIRPNSFAASALLARVYLYTGNWAGAEAEATRVISQAALYELVPDLNGIFLKNSKEAIWQLMPTNPQFNTFEASIFRSLSIAAVSHELYQAVGSGDLRKARWFTPRTSGTVTYQSPFKYKVGTTGQPLTEYSMVLRLAEVFLIRAEVRAHLGDVAGGVEDLNRIRQRAGLAAVVAVTSGELLDAVVDERRVELYSEWGHRWLDLKRTGRADAVLSVVKAEWSGSDALYPVPKGERDNNVFLTQNPGY